MKQTRIFVTTITILFIILFVLQPIYAASTEAVNRNVYVVVINKLTLSDIEKMPRLIDLIDDGTFGLMNVRGVSGYSGAESFATINASNKTHASNQSSQFHNLDSNFKEIYENRVDSLNREYAIGNIELGRLYNQNVDNRYSPHIGALGDSLHNNGLKTAIFGNSDTDEDFVRTAALIPMDSNGLIDYGNIDNILVNDKDYPYELKTDYNKILEEILYVKDYASLIVIDTGDLMRLNSYSDVLSDESFNEKRDLILNGIDEFIGELSNSVNKEQSLLIILSPNNPEERIDDSKLAPVILWGQNVGRGITVSSTTNRDGVISNLDIASTITDFLNISLEKGSGNIIECVKKDNALDYIKSINGRINLTSYVRSKTLTTYGVISIVVLLAVSFVLLLKIKMDKKIKRILKILLLILYGLPLIFMLISLFKIDNLLKFIISMILSIGIYIFVVQKFNDSRVFHLLTFSYFVVILVDVFSNGFITKYSVLGHDPIIGARYFGIGNEMVGLFLAVSMLSLGLIYRKCNKKAIFIFILLFLIIIVGHPKLGANVGGMITFVTASLFFVFEIFDTKLNFKNIIFIAISVLVAIAVFGYIDVNLNPNPTHLGKLLINIKNEGLYIVEDIINRKLLMNIKLVGTSFWTKVLFVNIIVNAIISYFYKERFIEFLSNGLKIGYLSCIAGSIIGFAMNDSGLILAAISMNIISIFLLFALIDDNATYNKQEVD